MAAKVEYSCDCKRKIKLDESLYYCQGCSKIRCLSCTTQEIDSFFCPHCLEMMSSSEVSHFKNSCKKCFECPSCFSILSYHSTSILSSSSSSSSEGKVYFDCLYCLWNSNSIGLVGENINQLINNCLSMVHKSTSGNDSNKDTISSLIEKYQLEEREKSKERRQQSRIKKSNISVLNKPLLPILPLSTEPSATTPSRKSQEEIQSIENEELILEEMRRNTEPNLISTIEQRFFQPSQQSRKQSDLIPRRKPLLSRRSKHCSVCDKIMIKPDLNPAKIEFKRQHVALSWVPKITILPNIPKSSDQEGEIIIRLTNPLHYLVQIHIKPSDDSAHSIIAGLPCDTFISPKDYEEEDDDEEVKRMKSGDTKMTQIVARKNNWVQIRIRAKLENSQKIIVGLVVEAKQKSGNPELQMDCSFPCKITIDRNTPPTTKSAPITSSLPTRKLSITPITGSPSVTRTSSFPNTRPIALSPTLTSSKSQDPLQSKAE